MKRGLLLGATLIAIPLTAALAQTPTPAPGPNVEPIVQARKAAMFLSGGNLAAMKFAAESGTDIRQLNGPAMSLMRWAQTVPAMFPAGSDGEPSRARPEVWSDRTGFEAAAAAYATAAERLYAAALAGDREVFLERWAEVRGTCGACHDAYKN